MRCTLLLTLGTCLLAGERAPMTVNFQDSAPYRWLNKKVLESHLLDDMKTLDTWAPFTKDGIPLVDARVPDSQTRPSAWNETFVEMKLTKEQSRDGGQSLRLRMPTKLDKPAPAGGRGWGDPGVIRRFGGEDWRKFNRISLWIYPDCPGFYVDWLRMRVHNDGAEKLPAAYGQEGDHFVNLRDREWNHVVWEIGNVARDKVVGLEISNRMEGNEPEEGDAVTFYLDRLELERVEPD